MITIIITIMTTISRMYVLYYSWYAVSASRFHLQSLFYLSYHLFFSFVLPHLTFWHFMTAYIVQNCTFFVYLYWSIRRYRGVRGFLFRLRLTDGELIPPWSGISAFWVLRGPWRGTYGLSGGHSQLFSSEPIRGRVRAFVGTVSAAFTCYRILKNHTTNVPWTIIRNLNYSKWMVQNSLHAKLYLW